MTDAVVLEPVGKLTREHLLSDTPHKVEHHADPTLSRITVVVTIANREPAGGEIQSAAQRDTRSRRGARTAHSVR